MHIPFAIMFLNKYLITTITFPTHSARELENFIKTPQLWENRPAMLLGLPPLQIHNVRTHFVDEKAKYVTFTFWGNRKAILKCSKDSADVKLCVEDLCTIWASIPRERLADVKKVLENSLVLVVEDKSKPKWLSKVHPDYMKILLKNFFSYMV